mmetsp:Transcript_26801/g.45694  ORF Transcript_26801/g.45694 Transcript_26801/m.45694 type:complete len:269 (-) Transcript_26801:218-1024(-)
MTQVWRLPDLRTASADFLTLEPPPARPRPLRTCRFTVACCSSSQPKFLCLSALAALVFSARSSSRALAKNSESLRSSLAAPLCSRLICLLSAFSSSRAVSTGRLLPLYCSSKRGAKLSVAFAALVLACHAMGRLVRRHSAIPLATTAAHSPCRAANAASPSPQEGLVVPRMRRAASVSSNNSTNALEPTSTAAARATNRRQAPSAADANTQASSLETARARRSSHERPGNGTSFLVLLPEVDVLSPFFFFFCAGVASPGSPPLASLRE